MYTSHAVEIFWPLQRFIFLLIIFPFFLFAMYFPLSLLIITIKPIEMEWRRRCHGSSRIVAAGRNKMYSGIREVNISIREHKVGWPEPRTRMFSEKLFRKALLWSFNKVLLLIYVKVFLFPCFAASPHHCLRFCHCHWKWMVHDMLNAFLFSLIIIFFSKKNLK